MGDVWKVNKIGDEKLTGFEVNTDLDPECKSAYFYFKPKFETYGLKEIETRNEVPYSQEPLEIRFDDIYNEINKTRDIYEEVYGDKFRELLLKSCQELVQQQWGDKGKLIIDE